MQRQLGVTYTAAWRMANVDGNKQIAAGTNLAIDEALIGGVKRGAHDRGSAAKTIFVGALDLSYSPDDASLVVFH